MPFLWPDGYSQASCLCWSLSATYIELPRAKHTPNAHTYIRRVYIFAPPKRSLPCATRPPPTPRSPPRRPIHSHAPFQYSPLCFPAQHKMPSVTKLRKLYLMYLMLKTPPPPLAYKKPRPLCLVVSYIQHTERVLGARYRVDSSRSGNGVLHAGEK